MNARRSEEFGLGIVGLGRLVGRGLVARGLGIVGGLLASAGATSEVLSQNGRAERRAERQGENAGGGDGERRARATQEDRGGDGDGVNRRQAEQRDGNGGNGNRNGDDDTTPTPTTTPDPTPTPTPDAGDGGDTDADSDGGAIAVTDDLDDAGDDALADLDDRIRARVADALDGSDDDTDGPLAISGDDVVAGTGPDGAFARSGDNIARTGPDGPIAISGGGDDEDDDGGDDVDFSS